MADDPSTTREELRARCDELGRQNEGLRQLVQELLAATLGAVPADGTSHALALEGNRDGLWDWNAVTNEVHFSPRWKAILGFEDQELEGTLAEWDSRIHPEDRDAVYADLNRHLMGETDFYENEHRLRAKDGSYRWVLDRGKVLTWTEDGDPLRVVGTHTDITRRKTLELERERLLRELQEAQSKIKVLAGLLPICACCKRIRDDSGYWQQIEAYISQHSHAEFSHGICPACLREHYPDLYGE